MFTKPIHQKAGAVRIVVDRDRCLYCGACVAACPPDAIYLRNGALTIDERTCTGCARCARMCPVGALSAQAAVAAPNGLNGHAAQR
ncbi:MAG: 4Fe-4S binding protein [Thermoflexales bacterium]|nr:4Fe-4S binding protein [Thermoflexales bacterium]MBP8242346.1 4Fe-4S binding protein [Thermoflexales bacterium]